MPFIQLKPEMITFYTDPSLSESEKKLLLQELADAPDLLSGVRFYEEEFEYLDEYYDSIDLEKITAYRLFPAYLKPSISTRQAALVMVGVTGKGNGHIVMGEKYFGCVGCYPLSVQTYSIFEDITGSPYSLQAELDFKETNGHEYLRTLTATNPEELAHTLNEVPAFTPSTENIVGLEDSIETFRSTIEELIESYPGSNRILGTEDDDLFLSEAVFPSYFEVSRAAELYGLELDGPVLSELISLASKKAYGIE